MESEKVDQEQEAKVMDDLSKRQEKAVLVMNLISLEEHFGFTAMKTRKPEYLSLLEATREMRKDILKEIVTNTEGENWCISKHLLSATMRMMETGSRYLSEDSGKASEYYDRAFDLFSIFWLLQGPGGLDGRTDGKTNEQTETKTPGKTGKKVQNLE